MAVCFSAMRQSREFPANASMAEIVRIRVRIGDIATPLAVKRTQWVNAIAQARTTKAIAEV
jgi:hypothetical protein